MTDLFLDILDKNKQKKIAINKALAISRGQGKWRDYVDLYFLLKEKYITMEEIVDLSQKRYQNEFPTRLFLQQLCYFDDLGNFAIDFMKDKIDPEVVKEYLINAVKEFETK